MHRKTKDHIQSQEVSGAIISILSFFIVLFLIRSEWNSYRKVEMVSSMVPDTKVGIESIEIQFSVQFKSVGCGEIRFEQSVTRGTLHLHDPAKITKTSTGARGCLLSGSVVVDKMDGNFRFSIDPKFGKADTNIMMPGMEPFRPLLPKDMTHTINYIRFIPKEHVDDSGILELYPEDSTFFSSEVATDQDTGMFHYGIRVVSTHERYMNKTMIHKTQLSVTDKPVALDILAAGASIAGQTVHNQLGLLFTYDFYPIMLQAKEKRMQTLFQFITGLCAIIGGTITVLGLLGNILQSLP